MTASCHAKMLRYFCILSLLICIQQSFCYDYAYENINRGGTYRRSGKKIGTRNSLQRGVDSGRRKFDREYEEIDRNPAAKFDVASFIQKPDEDAVQDYSFEHKDSSRPSKEYNDYGSLNDVNTEESIKKREKSQDYFNVGADNTPDLNLGSPLYKDVVNPEHSNMNTLTSDDTNCRKNVQSRENKDPKPIYKDAFQADINPSHSTEKKCSYKSLKFPFFSRNKSDTAKTKNNKKRKIFCINCPKKAENDPQKPSDLHKVSDKIDNNSKLIKRSYEEKLCPACKKKFIANVNRRSVIKRRFYHPKKLFHNGRQAQNVGNEKLSRGKCSKESSTNENDAYEARGTRKRRDDNKEPTNKQLKEVQEVERRVDSTEVTVPTIPKTNENV